MKKGFTIVELMTTIVILAIVTLIGVSGYRTIAERLKQTSYENKVSLIETKAADYANETGYLATNVDNLVKQGYLEADNEAEEVLDPRDGKVMNCHVVNITNEEENFYGKFTDKEECDNNNVEVVNMHVGIHIYKESNRSEVANNTWVGENVILEAYFKDENTNENAVKKITWSSNAGREERVINGDFNSKKEYIVNASQIVNTTYKVVIEMNDGVIYQTQVIVKIDKQKPVIYDAETIIENQNEFTNEEKEVRISASDGNGSGIYGYYIGTDNRCTGVTYEENHSNVYTKRLGAGTYYVCVRDNVGNVSEDISTKRIVVEKIDKIAPTCELEAVGTLGNNNYYTSDVTIRFKKAEDRESGISHTLINKPTITSDTNGTTITGTVVDKAGNTGTCNITIKMDKTKPTCSLKANGTKGNNEWYISNIGISFASLQDNMSGVMTSGIERTSITENTRGVTIKANVKDKAGNENTCEIRVKKDSETPRIEAINNPQNLNSDAYELKNNIRATFGVSGGLIISSPGASGMSIMIDKSIECNPSVSLGTGSYQVTCRATGGNGLSSSTTFQVNHSYPAISYYCEINCNPHEGMCGGYWTTCSTPTGPCHYEGEKGSWWCESYADFPCMQGGEACTIWDRCPSTCYKCNDGDGSTLNINTNQCEF